MDAVLQVSDTLYQKVLAAQSKPPAHWLTSSESATVKLDPADIPKDQKGKKLLNKLEVAKLELAASAGLDTLNDMRNHLVEKDKAGGKTSAIYQAVKLLSDQLKEQKAQPVPQPVAEAPAEPQQSGDAPATGPSSLVNRSDIPTDDQGKPVIMPEQVQQLEEAIPKGILAFDKVKWPWVDATEDMDTKKAIMTTADQMYNKWNAQNTDGEAAPATVPEAPGVTPEAWPSSLLTQSDILTDAEGKLLVTPEQVKSLEAALDKGSMEFYELKEAMAHEAKGSAAKHALLSAAYLMQENWKEAQPDYTVEELEASKVGTPPVITPGVAPAIPKLDDSEIPKDAKGNPLVSKANVKKLEEALPGGVKAFFNTAWDLAEQFPNNPQKQDALIDVAELLQKKWQPALDAPEVTVAPVSQPVSEVPPEPMPYNLTNDEIPKDANGDPMVTEANVKKLEEAAANGLTELTHVKSELAKKVKNQSHKMAIMHTADLLYNKATAAKYQESVTADLLKAPDTQPSNFKPTLTDSDIGKEDGGKALLSPDQVQQLEEAAAQGKYALAHKASELAQEVGYQAGPQFYAVMQATDSLSAQLHKPADQPEPVAPEPVAVSEPKAVATPGPKLADTDIPKALGKPQLTEDEIKTLEEAAAKGVPELKAAGAQLVDGITAKYKQVAIMNTVDLLHSKLLEAEETPPFVPEPVSITYFPTLAEMLPGPKVTNVPKDNKGKNMVIPANVKKLEKAAAKNLEELDTVTEAMVAKMLSPAKKAAIKNMATDLKSQLTGVEVQEGDGGSGLSAAIEQVGDGQVKLPTQTVPTPKVVTQQVKLAKAGKKDYDKDLENVSGKKGSNEGGLFKDQKLQTLHYVKWPNSSLRAKNEVLAAHLYEYAQVPVPSVKLIKFNNQDAVMSDWIEDAAPMLVDVMKTSHDVQRNFAFDAWLANWDVVGTAADNIVQGPGYKAYRIDMGGSLLFRAQGKPRPFEAEVKELVTMRDQGINPKAAQVFGSLTNANLKHGAERLATVTDQQIDEAVDALDFPAHSDEYSPATYGKDASNLPKMLKDRLKARRDYIVDEIMFAEEKKAATLASLKDTVDLKPESLSEVLSVADTMTWSSPNTTKKWEIVTNILEKELGATKGKAASNALKNHYKSWKGTTNSSYGDLLRWAAGEMYSRGDVERSRLDKYNKFLIKKKLMSSGHAANREETLTADIKKPTAKRLVEGLDIMQEKNEAILRVQNPGKETMTVYRGWKPDQVEYLKLTTAKVGSVVGLNDPPLYSWSFSPGVAENFGHGSIVTKAEVPVDNFVLSDLANSTGNFGGENEALFKGVSDLKMEVIKKH